MRIEMKKSKCRSHTTSTILECGYDLHALSSGMRVDFQLVPSLDIGLTSAKLDSKRVCVLFVYACAYVSVTNAILPFVLSRLRIIKTIVPNI
jgi:hypothetical protein